MSECGREGGRPSFLCPKAEGVCLEGKKGRKKISSFQREGLKGFLSPYSYYFPYPASFFFFLLPFFKKT